jgi:hypothetical protein
MRQTRILIAALPVLMLAAPATAAEVRLRGSLLSSCVLSLSTEGRLAISAGDPTMFGSEESGGLAATMTVVAIGASPSVSFSAPIVDAPSGFSSSAQAAIRYTSLGGSSQAYTSAASSSSTVRLLDTFTINSRITSVEGFQSGNYVVRTVATCQQ